MNDSEIAEATQLEAEKKFEEAIALLRVLVNQDPSCVDAYIHLAADSGIHGRFPQAEQYARRALALDPASGQARYYLACALRNQKRLDEASHEMEQALYLVKREVTRGTVAEDFGLYAPMYGWARHVEQDARVLRIQYFVEHVKTILRDIKNSLRPRKSAPYSLTHSGEIIIYRNER
jgi:tetratricopeptide (TPR) repeat protein